jgi:hypothetical protein
MVGVVPMSDWQDERSGSRRRRMMVIMTLILIGFLVILAWFFPRYVF